jgi:hypothetical protein
MWMQSIFLGLLAISDTTQPEFGQARLTFHVKDVYGKPVDNVRIGLAVGADSATRLTTHDGEVTLALSWNQLPVQQKLKVHVAAPSRDAPFVVEAIATSVVQLKLPQLWSAMPDCALGEQVDRLRWIFLSGSGHGQVCDEEFVIQVVQIETGHEGGFVDNDGTRRPSGIYPETPGSFHVDDSPYAARTWAGVWVFLLRPGAAPVIPPARCNATWLPAAQPPENALTITPLTQPADSLSRCSSTFVGLHLVTAHDLFSDAGIANHNEVVPEPFRDLKDTMDPIRRLFPFPSAPVTTPRSFNGLSFGGSFIF